jgi:hypothetical protein
MSLARPSKSETLSQATEALHRGDETAISEDYWRKSGNLAKETKNWCQTLAKRVPSERAETGTYCCERSFCAATIVQNSTKGDTYSELPRDVVRIRRSTSLGPTAVLFILS